MIYTLPFLCQFIEEAPSRPCFADYGDETDDEKEVIVEMKHRGFLTINCAGRVYRLSKDLIATKKNTLLEKLLCGVEEVPDGVKLDVNYYFFNRNPDIFHLIVHFYKTGVLHIPHRVCSRVVKKELKFWRIRELRIETCCYVSYAKILTEINQSKSLIAFMNDVDYKIDAVSDNSSFIQSLRMHFSFIEKKGLFAQVSEIR